MPKPVKMDLKNGQELFMVTLVGLMRKLVGRAKGLSHAYNFKGTDSWGMDIEAAAAEAVVAKYLNLFWSPGGVRANADVGDQVQVRWSPRPNGRLILHNEDKDDQPFVLVTGEVPYFTIVGWIYGRTGKDKRFWNDPGTGRPAYFVGQDYLADMMKLKVIVHNAVLKELGNAYREATTEGAEGADATTQAGERRS